MTDDSGGKVSGSWREDLHFAIRPHRLGEIVDNQTGKAREQLIGKEASCAHAPLSEASLSSRWRAFESTSCAYRVSST